MTPATTAGDRPTFTAAAVRGEDGTERGPEGEGGTAAVAAAGAAADEAAESDVVVEAAVVEGAARGDAALLLAGEGDCGSGSR